jgi:glycosyltransferase involved in cell wall biosynthesis
MPIIQNKVSVVLPVRYVNREWLTQSIRSVLEQDYENLELIVVNDEATEDIDELVRSLGVHKYVKNDGNRKLPYSLNRGFESADGEYHTWTSADNYMLPGMVSRLMREMKSRPEISLVCARMKPRTNDGCLLDETPGYIAAAKAAGTRIGTPTVERKYTFFSTIGACFLYKSEVWERLSGYDENLHGAEDYDFWIRASRNYTIGQIPWEEPAYYVYRTHQNSMSSLIPHCYTVMRLEVLRRELRTYPDDPDIPKAMSYYERYAQMLDRQRLLSYRIFRFIRSRTASLVRMMTGATHSN